MFRRFKPTKHRLNYGKSQKILVNNPQGALILRCLEERSIQKLINFKGPSFFAHSGTDLNLIIMKTRYKKIFGIFLLTLWLAACDGEIKKNPYLGRIPSIEKKYQTQIMELVEGVDKSGDLANTIPLIEQFDRIEFAWNNAINEEVRVTDLSKPIPVDYPENLPFRVKDARVLHVSRGNLVLQFNIEAVDTISDARELMMIFEALDKKGQRLLNTTSVANRFEQQQLLPGMEWTLDGYWETEAIVHLENLDRISVVRLEGLQ